ncbi:MAG: FAD-dependent monooxygenase [Alteromonadaceae bacterium]|nr:FAD-dependent monooxygenase [Alteromonadaceae bacterium]
MWSVPKNELNNRFKHWPQPIATIIINKTPISSINKIYVHDHNPIKFWSKNNVLLIGDAAHAPLPTSGQGACQALEDAWHLANCLMESDGEINQALSHFNKLRSAKTTGIIMGGRQLAKSIFNNDPIYCQQRNLASINTDFQSAVMGMAKGWANGLPISF